MTARTAHDRARTTASARRYGPQTLSPRCRTPRNQEHADHLLSTHDFQRLRGETGSSSSRGGRPAETRSERGPHTNCTRQSVLDCTRQSVA